MAKRGQAISKKYAALLLALVLLLASAIGGALWIILSENKITSSKYDKQELFFDFSASAIFYGEQFANKSGDYQSISGVTAYRKEKEIVGGETKEVYIPFTNLSDIGEVRFTVPQTTQHTATGTYSKSRPSLGEGNAYANADTLLTTVGDKITVNLSGEAAGLYYVPAGGFTVPMKAVVYQGSINDASVYYTRIEDALEVGAASATSQKFYVLPLKEKGFAPTITENCTVAAGDSLVLKIDEVDNFNGDWDITEAAPEIDLSDSTKRNENYRGKSGVIKTQDENGKDVASWQGPQVFADTNKEKYFKNEVVINTNVTVNIESEAILFVAGVTGTSKVGMQGFTSGNYAQISMKSGAKINCKEGGVLDCLGFIKESGSQSNGSQIINNGTVYSPFVVYDFRGGKSTVGAYLNQSFNILQANSVAKQTGKIFPFSIFDLPNIHPQMITEGSEAEVKGYADIFTGGLSGVIDAQHNLTMVDVIGHTDNCIIILNDESKMVSKFKGDGVDVTISTGVNDGRNTDGRTTINLYGGASLGKGSLEVSVAGLIHVTVTSSGLFFPISWKYDIILNDIDDDHSDNDSIYTIGEKAKFLSGSSLTVNQGAKLDISSEVVFFPESVTYNTANYRTDAEDNRVYYEDGQDPSNNANFYCDKTPATTADPTYIQDDPPGRNYPGGKKAATLTVNGELNVTADGVVGGKVLTGQQGAKLNIEGSAFEVTSEEGYGTFSGTFYITCTFIPVDAITQKTNIDVYNGTGVDLSKPLDAPGTYYSVQVSGSNYAWLPAFNVTLNANGGAFGDGSGERNYSPAKAGIDLSAAENVPTRAHYHFTHWCTNASCTNGADCTSKKEGVLYADATLYAIWEENAYYINYKYVLPDGSITDSGIAKTKFTVKQSNQAIAFPSITNIPADGNGNEYSFSGWYTAKDGAIIDQILATEYLAKVSKEGDSVTIYAVWVADPVYTVNFITNNADFAVASTKITDNDTASLVPQQLTGRNEDENYSHYFEGWYIDQDLTIPYANWAQLRDGAALDGEETFKRTLYAKWIKKHTVIIDINAGASGDAAPEAENATVYLVDGQSYTLPAGLESKNQILTVTHYFAGWQLSDQSLGQLSGEAGVSSLSLKATGDITVTAVWKLKHELSFVTSYPEDINTNEHIIEVMPPIYLLSGQSHDISQYNGKVTANDSNTAIKYYFGNWRKNGVDGEVYADSTVVFAEGEQDLELYAYWLNKTEIVFATDFNEGAIGVEPISIAPVYYKEGTHELAQYQQEMTKYNSNEHANQYFRGWAFSDNIAEIIAQVEVADNGGLGGKIELVAIWENKYTIRFSTSNYPDGIVGNTEPFATINDIYLYGDTDYALTEQLDIISAYNEVTWINYYTTGWSILSGVATLTGNTLSNVQGNVLLMPVWDEKVTVSITINYDESGSGSRSTGAKYNINITGSNSQRLPYKDHNNEETIYQDVSLSSQANVTIYLIRDRHKVTVQTSRGSDGDLDATDWAEKLITDNAGGEFTAYNYRYNVCIVEGTLVTLADGTQKAVEDLQNAEEVLVFNHETGKLEKSYIAIRAHLEVERAWYNVINLEFSDGSVLRIVWNHGLYNLTLNKYVFINEGNYGEYVGDSFYSAVYENGAFIGKSVTLVRAYITYEFVKIYSPTTVSHINFFASNMLNVTAIPVGALDCGHVNIFDYDSDMKYDEAKKQADIEKYGLYTYEDFKDYVSYEVYQYLDPAFKYLKVAVEKGKMTWEEVLALLRYITDNDLIDEETPME